MTAVNGISSNAYYELQRLQGGVAQNTVYQTENGNLFNTNGYAVSASGETCTDGKDDGKIGFGSALWNTIKGVGKTVVNGVKGMFTNKEGKFSLGKTLLSLGTAALCVAFPAVGLGLACVGAAAGAVQVGKGIYGAVTADTDAEAKEAWQNIGGGTFTVAVSVAGAKASYKAMKGSATGSYMDKNGNTVEHKSLLKEFDNADNKLDFSKVKDDKMGFAKALWEDAKNSTKNNYHSIKSAISAKRAEFKVNRQNSKLTSEYDKLAKNAAKEQAEINKDTSIVDKEAKIKEVWKKANEKHTEEFRENYWKTHEHDIDAGTVINTEKISITDVYKDVTSSLSKFFTNDKGKISLKNLKPSEIISKLKETDPKIITDYGYENVLQVIKTLVADENLINGDSI